MVSSPVGENGLWDLKLFPVTVTQETRHMSSLEHNLAMGKPKRRAEDKHHQEAAVTVSLRTNPLRPA